MHFQSTFPNRVYPKFYDTGGDNTNMMSQESSRLSRLNQNNQLMSCKKYRTKSGACEHTTAPAILRNPVKSGSCRTGSPCERADSRNIFPEVPHSDVTPNWNIPITLFPTSLPIFILVLTFFILFIYRCNHQ